jgi:hypothetical protein
LGASPEELRREQQYFDVALDHRERKRRTLKESAGAAANSGADARNEQPHLVVVRPARPDQLCSTIGAGWTRSAGSVLAPQSSTATRSPSAGTYPPVVSAASAAAVPCSTAIR